LDWAVREKNSEKRAAVAEPIAVLRKLLLNMLSPPFIFLTEDISNFKAESTRTAGPMVL
jgi:hypothetical protein